MSIEIKKKGAGQIKSREVIGKCESCSYDIVEQKGTYPEWYPENMRGKKYTLRQCKCEDVTESIKTQETHARVMKNKAAHYFELYSVMNEELKAATFSSFMADPHEPTQMDALNKVSDLANAVIQNKDPKNILIAGNVGLGKSHLAAAACSFVTQHAMQAAFISIPLFKRKLKTTWNRNTKITEDDIYNFIAGVDLLVIDDIGTGKKDESTDEIIMMLTDSRQGKFNIFTTNLSSPDLLESVDVRVFDRLKRNTLPLKIEGKSRRQFLKKEDFVW